MGKRIKQMTEPITGGFSGALKTALGMRTKKLPKATAREYIPKGNITSPNTLKKSRTIDMQKTATMQNPKSPARMSGAGNLSPVRAGYANGRKFQPTANPQAMAKDQSLVAKPARRKLRITAPGTVTNFKVR